MLNKQYRTADREWPSSLGVWQGADNPPPHLKKTMYCEVFITASEMYDDEPTASNHGVI
jgi:hypothetical protein